MQVPALQARLGQHQVQRRPLPTGRAQRLGEHGPADRRRLREPALAVSDPVYLSQAAGMTLLVFRHDKTTRRDVASVRKAFDLHGMEASGAILNDYPANKRRRGYAYEYRYAYDSRR